MFGHFHALSVFTANAGCVWNVSFSSFPRRRQADSPSPFFLFFLLQFLGKRRYDRKQAGFGGQTKPVFRKKVRFFFLLFSSTIFFLEMCEMRAFFLFHFLYLSSPDLLFYSTFYIHSFIETYERPH